MKILGLLLIISGIVGLGLVFWPTIKLEVAYQQQEVSNQQLVPLDTNLGIVIPKIGANAAIVAKVNPFDSAAYQQALTKGVAHAQNTVLPGDQGNSFLFSHSSIDFFRATQFNSVFYLLSKMELGDQIFIYRDEQKISFSVTKKIIVSETAIEYLSEQSDIPTITLMTCWPPGTSLKRLVVTASIDR